MNTNKFSIGIGVTVFFIVFFIALSVHKEIAQTLATQHVDQQDCINKVYIDYCSAKGLKHGTKIITPQGIFAGPPYTANICYEGSNEQIIDKDLINWEICSPIPINPLKGDEE